MATTNEEFFRRHARPGMIALVGGTSAIDRGIRFAQRHLLPEKRHSCWSHVFVIQGERVDGHLWVIESDIDVRFGKMLRVGVQESRISKYGDPKAYPNLAILDFGLSEEDGRRVVAGALDFVSDGTRYALGGIFKTYVAILRKQVGKERKTDSNFCSSFVRSLYQNIGIDLAPGVAVRHTSPEHVAQAKAPHERHELVREK